MPLRLFFLAAAFGLGTWVFGWWAVPAIGAAWGLLARGAPGSALAAGVGALLAWAALLGLTAAGGHLGVLLDRVAPLVSLPGIAVVAVTLLLAALLALLAAAFTGALAAPRTTG